PALVQAHTTRPKDPRIQLALAYAYAGVGDSDRAVSEATAASQAVTQQTDPLLWSFYAHGLALIQERTGHLDDARATLNRILSAPSPYSMARLRLSPAWDPLKL